MNGCVTTPLGSFETLCELRESAGKGFYDKGWDLGFKR